MEEVKKKRCGCCVRCNIEKSVSDFYYDKTATDHLYCICKSCTLAMIKARRERNLNESIRKEKKYRKLNSQQIGESAVRWKRNNKEKVKEISREYMRERRKTDPAFKLQSYLRSRLGTVLKKQSATKFDKTIILLGCSIQELKQHLESQFTEGMFWDNYGEWQVDHIKPCAAFDLTKDENQKICFHYTNLQPLWAKDNREKSSFYKGKKYIKGYEVVG